MICSGGKRFLAMSVPFLADPVSQSDRVHCRGAGHLCKIGIPIASDTIGISP
jgi:hypothetical protein